jgi:hypothetical protein
MRKRYRVALEPEERAELGRLLSRGRAAARKLTHARVLLPADEAEAGPAKRDAEVAEALGCGRATVERARKRFVEEGPQAALVPRPTSRVYERRLDGEAEARLIALACSPPPEGRGRWTLRLLADRVVALGYVEAVSHEAVRRTLKKTRSSPG